ncbi:hypothetical protein KKA00_06680, partial [bacterium]|nr:hypothetical protein [bacterium]
MTPLAVVIAEEIPYPNDYCQECHSDAALEAEDGHNVYADEQMIENSVHTGVACYQCHNQPQADFEDIPHFEEYTPVDCNQCHRREGMVWMEYFYKMLEKKGETDIPDCKECHGLHDVKRHMGTEIVCDRCHKDIAEAYKQSYHYAKYQE